MKNSKAICNVNNGLYFSLCLIFSFISNLAFSQDFTEAGVNTYAKVQTTKGNGWNVTNEDMVISIQPYFQVQPRLYYNLKRREKKEKIPIITMAVSLL